MLCWKTSIIWRPPLAAAGRLQSQPCPCWIYGKRSVNGTDLFFPPSTSVFPCHYHSTTAPQTFSHVLPTLYSISNWQITSLKKTRETLYYHLRLRRVRATTVAEENKYYIFRACVCSLRYLAWNTHTSYCNLLPARIYGNVSLYLINDTIFEKNVIEHAMCVLISLQLLSEIFLILRKKKIGEIWWKT